MNAFDLVRKLTRLKSLIRINNIENIKTLDDPYHMFQRAFYIGDGLDSFNSWMRLMSGIILGLAIVWFAFSHIEAYMIEMAGRIGLKFQSAGLSLLGVLRSANATGIRFFSLSQFNRIKEVFFGTIWNANHTRWLIGGGEGPCRGGSQSPGIWHPH
jgi:RNAse (barnase) inhibitor barstar